VKTASTACITPCRLVRGSPSATPHLRIWNYSTIASIRAYPVTESTGSNESIMISAMDWLRLPRH
tara:strand:+ start:87776 stop:87970 length:195 start_codon:yes stop_codon:yes gene_type:complete